MQVLKMQKSNTIKDYLGRLLGIANEVRLLGTEFIDSRIVQKILVTVPEIYEASITTLENTKDLSKITLAELLNALQAQEQRRLMRQERTVEGALPAKHQDAGKYRRKMTRKAVKALGTAKTTARVAVQSETIHLVGIVGN